LIKSRQSATPYFQKPVTSQPTAARERPSGCSGLGAVHRTVQSAQKPCGYCFASVFVPISDENRDGLPVAFRDCTEKPAPYPASGPHSPSKVGNARAPMRVFPAPARRERFRKHVWPADFTWPGKLAQPNLPGPGISRCNQRRNTQLAAFLRTFPR